MARKEISAAEAVKAFKTKPTVQTARAAKIEVKDNAGRVVGKRDGFVTKDEPMREEHVLAAADYGDRVVVVTVDGKRHEARA